MADDTATYNAEYNGAGLVITSAIFLGLTYLSVGLRTYVRAYLTKCFQLDDWLMLVAQATFTVSCCFILVGVQAGMGRHNTALPQSEEIRALEWQALATASYIPNMMFIKLSLGVFLLRLAPQPVYKWIIWGSMGVVLLMSTVLFLWDVFQCKPVAAQWDYTIPNFTCVKPQAVVNAAYALSVLNIITDWLYALLPIPMIWKAKMSVQAKMTVAVVLGLGIFASIATLIRVKFLSDLTDTDDILFAGTEAMVWTLVEPGVAIVASSLVTIRPLLRQWRLKGFESSQRSRSLGGIGRRFGYGRSGVSEIVSKDQNNNNNNKRGDGERRAAVEDGFKLRDLESGGRRGRNGSRGGGGISASSTYEGGKSPLPGKVWGGGVTVREEDEKEDMDDDNNETSPSGVSSPGAAVVLSMQQPSLRFPWDSSSMRSSSESVFVIQGASEEGGRRWSSTRQMAATPSPMVRGHLRAGKTVWTPAMSAEESEGIQGLRYPTPELHRISGGGGGLGLAL